MNPEFHGSLQAELHPPASLLVSPKGEADGNRSLVPLLCSFCSDSTQLQQLHNQVLLEQQQLQNPSPLSPKESPFNMSALNSAPTAASISSKQAKGPAPAPQTFNLARPKHFFPASSTPTAAPASPCSSPVFTLSNTPQSIQRTVSKESLLMTQPSTPGRSPGGLSIQNEPAPPSPAEPAAAAPPPAPPAAAYSIPSGNQFQPHCVSPTPVSPTGRIQNPVAFLSSVLPSLPSIPPTNAMGLPKSAPSV